CWRVAPPVALGDGEGQVSLNVARNGGASSSILPMLDTHIRAAPQATYAGTEVVRLRRLDELYTEYCCSTDRILLKIDVQGYEKQVLDGARRFLERVH